MNSISTNKSSLRWYDPIFLIILPPVVTLVIKLLLYSCRVIKVEGREKEVEALEQSQGKAVYATWHQRVIFHARHLAHTNLTVMVSQSRDGEYAIRLVSLFGHTTVRGSSTRGGSLALKKLTQIVKEGGRGGILADGPIGPARKAKIGAVIMAHKAQAPLITVTWGADRCWVINSWDRFMMPKPFARVIIYYPEPIWIPPSADSKELGDYRRLLEERLNQGTSWCDNQFGLERPWRKVKEKGQREVGPLDLSSNQNNSLDL
jgi:lysophospholipid acyltransferase (LPLAT)-like uncharacterized protein